MTLDEALGQLPNDPHGAAWQVVLTRVTDMARRVARQHGLDVHVADDLAGAVLLMLVRSPVQPRDAEAFLDTCLRNAARSWLRRRDNRNAPLGSKEGLEPVDGPRERGREQGRPMIVRVGTRFFADEGEGKAADPADLQRAIERLRDVIREHLPAGTAQTVDGLLRIHLGQTSSPAEARDLGIELNALEARQSRARHTLSRLLQRLIGEAATEDEREELRRVERLGQALRKCRPSE